MPKIVEHKPRNCGDGTPLVTRQAAAYFLQRHPDQISRHCQPIACDVVSKLPLYSMDEAYQITATLRRRAVA
jgi:hypothetical protein